MSLFNQNQKKHKKYIYPKGSIKINKSFDSSSKSTRATSKNILELNNPKFDEKANYCDLYSDLLCMRQTEKNVVKKRYPKEENEESNNSLKSFEKFIFKKNKKSSVQKKLVIKSVKYYNEDGEIIKFPLFNEKDIKIDEYDNKVKIESAEDDFESDECTLDYGKKKVNNDLLEALSYIKKENTNCLVNYKKYGKYVKRPKKKLDLRKNLPFIPSLNKK